MGAMAGSAYSAIESDVDPYERQHVLVAGMVDSGCQETVAMGALATIPPGPTTLG